MTPIQQRVTLGILALIIGISAIFFMISRSSEDNPGTGEPVVAQSETPVPTPSPTTTPTPVVRVPTPTPLPVVTNKRIEVDLSDQRLTYFYEGEQVGSFLISSGLAGTPTPVGTFTIQAKRPFVDYIGTNYSYLKTKWNLQFKPRYYIHGAFWHNNFGTPMSHGCVNVSYANMESLYAFADLGTPVIIRR